MKPVYNKVAKTLKDENEKGIIAFVDATKERKLAERFKIKGFPTIKYFQVRIINLDLKVSKYLKCTFNRMVNMLGIIMKDQKKRYFNL